MIQHSSCSVYGAISVLCGAYGGAYSVCVDYGGVCGAYNVCGAYSVYGALPIIVRWLKGKKSQSVTWRTKAPNFA